METYVILDNLRSAHNVGSIFRTADAAAVKKLFLVGTTPTPVDRFGRKQKEIAKTALGAEKSVSWEYTETIEGVVSALQEKGVSIVAVEQDAKALSYNEYKEVGSCAYIFGNEVNGVSKIARNIADAVVEIPMRGGKESLNVAVVAGIILFAKK